MVSVPKVPKPHQAATSACTKNKEGPKPGEHVQPFRMERDHNKGFYSEKCKLEEVFEGKGKLLPPHPPLSNEQVCSQKIRSEREGSLDTPFGACDNIAKRR